MTKKNEGKIFVLSNHFYASTNIYLNISVISLQLSTIAHSNNILMLNTADENSLNKNLCKFLFLPTIFC